MNNVEFCFYHIPKCAGVSLGEILDNYFSKIYHKLNIYNSKNEPNLIEVEEKNSLNQIPNILNYKIVLSHIQYNTKISNTFKKQHFSFTVVRNPVDRIISHYYFFNYKENNKKEMMDFTDEELENYCHSMSRVTTAYFSSNDNYDLKIAKENILKIKYIAIFNNLDNDLNNLNTQLNKIYKVNHKFINIKSNQTKITPLNKDLLYTRIFNIIKYSDDSLLYNHILYLKSKKIII